MEWKSIPGFALYEASDLGRIRNGHTRVIHGTTVNKQGYESIQVKSDDGMFVRKSVHRLVAQTWLSTYSHSKQVNHKDGNKLNNAVSNLEMVTASENIKHAIEHKLLIPEYHEGNNNPTILLSVNDGKELTFRSLSKAAMFLGYSTGSISTIRRAINSHKVVRGYYVLQPENAE